jgi:hypothetical protein
VEHLVELHRVLLQHFVDQGELPANLTALNPALFEAYGVAIDPRRDPATGKLFEYERLSERQYEVCARFDTSSDDPRNPNQSFSGYRPVPPEGFLVAGYLEYKSGRNCFKRTLTNSEIRDLYPEKLPIPEEPRVSEAEASPPSPSITGNP